MKHSETIPVDSLDLSIRNNIESPTTPQSYLITGRDALRIAARDGVQLYCHANPIDPGGPVSVELGGQIVREDPSLLFVFVKPNGWVEGTGTSKQRYVDTVEGYNVGDYFTSAGMYLGSDDFGTEPRWADAEGHA